jgi:hypothetical protein
MLQKLIRLVVKVWRHKYTPYDNPPDRFVYSYNFSTRVSLVSENVLFLSTELMYSETNKYNRIYHSLSAT